MAHILSGFLLLFLVLSLHANVIAQQKDPNVIQPGSSLYAGKQPSSWPSSSGHFEFGFYPQGEGYVVGIWIVGRPENTIVWTAYPDGPPVSSNATLEFTTQDGLLLRTEDSVQNITNILRGTPSSKPIDSASMLDTGNFVLYHNRSFVWESFAFPTDTILGGQNLSSSSSLISSVSRSNQSSGHYSLGFMSTATDHKLVASYRENFLVPSYVYWTVPIAGNGASYLVLNLSKRGVLRFYSISLISSGVVRRPYSISSIDSKQVVANGSTTGNETLIIYRATLDPDGIFRLYSHQLESNTTSSWSPRMKWQSLNDQCDVPGHCGLNSYCYSRDKHVGCYCYPGFAFIDSNNEFLGCSQNFTVDWCETRKDVVINFNVTTLENMTWADDDPYSVKYNLEKEDCKKDCDKDCYCGGVLYSSGVKKCSMYSLPFKYGRRSGSIKTTAFIKSVLGSTAINSPERSPILINDGNQSLILTMGLSLGSVACLSLIIAICSFFVYMHRLKSYAKLFENGNSGFAEEFALRSFSFNELDEATHGFQDVLGRGSFGAVYKATLPGDGKHIVVKRLMEIGNRGERDQFRTEMTAIGRTNHRNLVRLLGFCAEGSRRLLVYEYLSNGSLANFLFDVNKQRPVWRERARIALDVAKGVLYLHEECEVCIIHCNIKPRNILLDDSMTAKISDFGLAKLLRPNQTSNSTTYSAPEWQSNELLSVKVDVYSFGVVLLEIICCRSNIEIQVGSTDEILLSTWVYSCFVSGELSMLVEGEEEVEMKMVKRFVKVALWCIQDDPNLRPLMKDVILMLEGTRNVPVPPSPSVVQRIC